MEITKELLIKMGFTEESTGDSFPRLRKIGDDPESMITLAKDHLNPNLDYLSWRMRGYRCDENGNIIRRVVVDGITTMEELKQSTDLCGLII